MRHRKRFDRLAIVVLLASSLFAASNARAQGAFDTGGASESEQPPVPAATKAPPRIEDWEDSDPVPVGYHVERRVRRNLIVEGGGLLVLGYVFAAFAAAGSSKTGALWVPVAGPFIEIPQVHSEPGAIVKTTSLATTLLVIDCIFQTSGAAMITYGLAVPEGHLVKDANAPTVAPMPMAFSRGVGFGLVGSF